MSFKLKFWGVRGSIACPSAKYVSIGGNTSCVEVAVGGERIILDCGTGVRNLGHWLLRKNLQRAHLLLSHTHWDHINGFPFFSPVFRPGLHFNIMAGHLFDKDLGIREVMAGQMNRPFFPVPLDELKATLDFQDFVAGLNQLVGPTEASAWLTGMAANGAKAYAKNGAIVEAVARGEIPMGLVNHYYVTETLAEDPATPIAAYRFSGDDPGSLFLVATASVPNPATGNAQAIALIDYLLSTEGQQLIIKGEGEYPTVEGVAPGVRE